MALWNTKKQKLPEDFYLSETSVVSKDLVEYLTDAQISCIRELWTQYKKEQGCILAEENGLGKINALLAFMSAIHLKGDKILIYCRNLKGIHHWRLQMSVFWPVTSSLLNTSSSEDCDVLFISPDVLKEASVTLTGMRIHYFIIDSRHSPPLTLQEINQIEKIPGKQRVFVSHPEHLNDDQYLMSILPCIDKKWCNLFKDTEDTVLFLAQKQKFILKHFRKDALEDHPLRDEQLYKKTFKEWRKSHPIFSEEFDELDCGEKLMKKIPGKTFFVASPLSQSDSGTPDLIFSEEEVKTSSKIFETAQKESFNVETDDSDAVIPPSPVEDSEPLFRKRPKRPIVLSTQASSSSESQSNVDILTQKPHPIENERKKSRGGITPNLFETSDEESDCERDKSALNTSTPLSNGDVKDFPISQSPIIKGDIIRKMIEPSEMAVDITGERSEVFEITTNPTFSHQIRVSSRREMSPIVINSSDSPKTPEQAKDMLTTSGKWGSSSRKRSQDKSETPRSSRKSTGWLTKESPKRSQRLSPRNLSVTFKVRQQEMKDLREWSNRPILTQGSEEGFPQKRRRLKDILLSSDDEEKF